MMNAWKTYSTAVLATLVGACAGGQAVEERQNKLEITAERVEGGDVVAAATDPASDLVGELRWFAADGSVEWNVRGQQGRRTAAGTPEPAAARSLLGALVAVSYDAALDRGGEGGVPYVTCSEDFRCDGFELYGMHCAACAQINADCSTDLVWDCVVAQ
jgi:hypothetical protein